MWDMGNAGHDKVVSVCVWSVVKVSGKEVESSKDHSA